MLGIAVALVAGKAVSQPFFAYLAEPDAALIAFNPSAFDPRQPAPRVPPPAEIIQDLAALRPAFNGLVLYAYEPQLTESVITAAAGAGFRAVLLGVWDPKSSTEIAGIAAILRHWQHRLALAVVLGNEGINDNRYTIEHLHAAAAWLRSLLPQDLSVPVTTSEPWADYGWPPLGQFGDFLAPNIHPALERPDLGPEAAAAWARARAVALARVTGRPVLVKETGWPNGGGPAFTPQAQAAFWRAWLAGGRYLRPHDAPIWVSYAAAFEAFDAPWKAAQYASGLEGHWGLLSPARTPYPALGVWRPRQ